MISILRATINDYKQIVAVGKASVTQAHQASCSAEILQEFVDKNYNDDEIKKELADANQIYHIICHGSQPIGFSKIILNANHPCIAKENVTKLDRIYLLKEFHGLKMGIELLNFNIGLARDNNQSGIWLYTWIGNIRAIDFYTRAGFSIIANHDFHVAKGHYNPNYQMFLNFSESMRK